MGYAFVVLFPIHLAAFLDSFVRKQLLSPAGGHMAYAAALLTNYAYLVLYTDVYDLLPALPIALLYAGLRFSTSLSKYALWSLCYILAEGSFLLQ